MNLVKGFKDVLTRIKELQNHLDSFILMMLEYYSKFLVDEIWYGKEWIVTSTNVYLLWEGKFEFYRVSLQMYYDRVELSDLDISEKLEVVNFLTSEFLKTLEDYFEENEKANESNELNNLWNDFQSILDRFN